MTLSELLSENCCPDEATVEPVATTGVTTVEANLPQLRELVLGTAQELAKLQVDRKRQPKKEREIEVKFNSLIDVISAAGAELAVTTTSIRSKSPVMFSHFSPITWSEGDAKRRKYFYASDCSSELKRLKLRDEENGKFKNAALYGVVNSRDLRYEDRLGHNAWYLHLGGEGMHFYIPVGGLKDISFGVRALPLDVSNKPKIPRKH